MAADAISIVNRALAELGCEPVQSFAEPGPAGDAPQIIYEGWLRSLISRNPWHFARTFAELARLTDAPLRGWKYAFVLPSNRTCLPRAYYPDAAEGTRPLTRFELSGATVLATSERLWADYSYVPPVTYWPGYFEDVVVLACKSTFAMSVREDLKLAQLLHESLFGSPQLRGQGGLFSEACSLDAQAQAAGEPDGGRNPIISARWSEEDARAGW